MVGLTLALAVSAVLLMLPPRLGRVIRRLRQRPDRRGAAAAGRNQGRGRLRMALAVTALAGLLVAVFLVTGSRGVVVTSVMVLVGSTVGKITMIHRRDKGNQRRQEEVAHACDVLAGQVRVGQVPAEALQIAAIDCPVLADGAAIQRIGGDVTELWRASASRPGYGGLLELARAWQVCIETGAPMARSLEHVAAALAADREVGLLVLGELAASRATGRMLAVLPLVGLGLGYLIGGDPGAFLMKNMYGQGCLMLGAMLACGGVLWIERIAGQTAGAGHAAKSN